MVLLNLSADNAIGQKSTKLEMITKALKNYILYMFEYLLHAKFKR